MIVDASVAFKWIFVETDSGMANALIGREDLFAPTLLLAELGNALWKKGRRGEIGDRDAYSTQIGLASSLVTTVDESDFVQRALDLALTFDHPIYDCIYLAMAEGMGQILVTADTHFLAKLKGSDFAAIARSLDAAA